MNGHKLKFSKRKIFGAAILLFCAFVFFCTLGVMFVEYRPYINSPQAFAGVCMDIVCTIILIMLVLNMVFEKTEFNRTTKLFLGLMLSTLLALFFDFLTWSNDGALSYHGWTYVWIVSSLFMGSIMAGFFVLYLCSYLHDVHGMKNAFRHARICYALNIAAFILTVILASLKKAFVIEDGHYKTGSLYEYVTVIPVLTLVYMACYTLKYAKVIGAHDVIAVLGYNITLISGALIEGSFGIGTTYVGLTLADFFVYVMLQNHLVDKVNRQKKLLSDKVDSQYGILESMAGIYSYVNCIDLKAGTSIRFDLNSDTEKELVLTNNHSDLSKTLFKGMVDEFKASFWAFTDLSSISDRMENEKIISAEFKHKDDGWLRAQYIRIGESVNEPINRVIFAIRNIDVEKRNVEKLIYESNTDELTGLYNRRAYEEEISALERGSLKNNFVYVSIDVNGLKITNDTHGHEAGDELLIGATECMKQCLGAYGKLFRTGGDEFVGLIYADDDQLSKIKNDIAEVTDSWQGKVVNHLAISCGFVSFHEAADMTIQEMARLADKRMYEEKTRYYQTKGIDRRGQRDSHIYGSGIQQ